MAKATFGLDENVAAALSYLLGVISGLVFLLAEKKNAFVRFHAAQSIVTFLSLAILSIIFGLVPFAGVAFSALLSIVALVLWVVLMYKAYKGEKYKLPIVGDMVEKWLK
ncbi:MAG: DUF4870 domain-containing protein [Candidatus Nanoarchaeia archaeon]